MTPHPPRGPRGPLHEPPSGAAALSVFRLEAVLVSRPHADEAPAEVRDVGLFTTLERAGAWLRANDLYGALHLDRATQRLLFVRAAERALGGAESDIRRWVILSTRGETLKSHREQGRELLWSPLSPPPGDDLLPDDGRLPPACCYQTDASFLFTSCGPVAHGIPGAELWFSGGELARNPTPRGPRLLVVPGIRAPRPLTRAVPVGLTPPFRAYGRLPKKLATHVVRFIEQNQAALLAHWHGYGDSLELLQSLRRLDVPERRAPASKRRPPPVAPPDVDALTEDEPGASLFCVEAAVARRPFVEGAVVDVYRLAHFEKSKAALTWARGTAARRALARQARPGRLLAIHVVTRRLDTGPRDYLAHVLLSPDGTLRERRTADDAIAAWRGRAPARCRWRPGDIVAALSHGHYRIGIVLERPWAPAWVRRHCRPGLTRDDDVYLVGFASGPPDHDHLREGNLFSPLTRVSKALEQRLQARYRSHRAGDPPK